MANLDDKLVKEYQALNAKLKIKDSDIHEIYKVKDSDLTATLDKYHSTDFDDLQLRVHRMLGSALSEKGRSVLDGKNLTQWQGDARTVKARELVDALFDSALEQRYQMQNMSASQIKEKIKSLKSDPRLFEQIQSELWQGRFRSKDDFVDAVADVLSASEADIDVAFNQDSRTGARLYSIFGQPFLHIADHHHYKRERVRDELSQSRRRDCLVDYAHTKFSGVKAKLHKGLESRDIMRLLSEGYQQGYTDHRFLHSNLDKFAEIDKKYYRPPQETSIEYGKKLKKAA